MGGVSESRARARGVGEQEAGDGGEKGPREGGRGRLPDSVVSAPHNAVGLGGLAVPNLVHAARGRGGERNKEGGHGVWCVF